MFLDPYFQYLQEYSETNKVKISIFLCDKHGDFNPVYWSIEIESKNVFRFLTFLSHSEFHLKQIRINHKKNAQNTRIYKCNNKNIEGNNLNNAHCHIKHIRFFVCFWTISYFLVGISIYDNKRDRTKHSNNGTTQFTRPKKMHIEILTLFRLLTLVWWNWTKTYRNKLFQAKDDTSR